MQLREYAKGFAAVAHQLRHIHAKAHGLIGVDDIEQQLGLPVLACDGVLLVTQHVGQGVAGFNSEFRGLEICLQLFLGAATGNMVLGIGGILPGLLLVRAQLRQVDVINFLDESRLNSFN